MARPLRLEFPGAIYHVTSRGNARAAVFVSDSDRRAFLATLAEVVERYGWLCHAYCLMGNHYHLLVETPDANLSRGMRQLNGLYTQRFNQRAGRVGHVFQGRFKAIVVGRESHLLELSRYVVLNPVRAKIAVRPEGYRWSSYRATAGLESAPAWLTVGWLLAQFGARRGAARKRYREFVREGLGRASPWNELRGQILLGSDEFAEKLRPLLEGKAAQAEVPQRQRLAHRPSLATLLPAAVRRDKGRRDRALREACVEHGYTLAEVGRCCGLHYATISRIVRRAMYQNKT
jgi:putative transposase